MSANPEPEAVASGLQKPPPPRQRQIRRAATFAESHSPVRAIPRRRSSMLSESSQDDLRRSVLRSSTDRPPPEVDQYHPENQSLLHSAPLAIAILPALSGLFFNNGTTLATDLLLLGLGSMFLNWCVRVPWDWYHSAQEVCTTEPEELYDDMSRIVEEDDSDAVQEEKESSRPSSPSQADGQAGPSEAKGRDLTRRQERAASELRRNEMMALAGCFLGPLLGAYILHSIRSQLSRPSEGLVSNYNLTIFVMASELRPCSHLIRLRRERLWHLQRIVRPDGGVPPSPKKEDLAELVKRVEDLQTRIDGSATQSPKGKGLQDEKVDELSVTVSQSLQPQLDALNRAVRRYEKRSTTQTMQTEARLNEMEARLRDALSLAAAAARTGQKPGVVAITLGWISRFFAFWISGAWMVVMYPFRLADSVFLYLKNLVAPSKKPPKKRLHSRSSDHGGLGTARLHPRSSRA